MQSLSLTRPRTGKVCSIEVQHQVKFRSMLLTCKDQIGQWKGKVGIEVKAGGGTGDPVPLEQWIKEKLHRKIGAGDCGVTVSEQE